MSQVRSSLKKIFNQFDSKLTKTDIRKINDFKKSLVNNYVWSDEVKAVFDSLKSECVNKDLVSDLLVNGELLKIAYKNSSSVKLLGISPEHFQELNKYLRYHVSEETAGEIHVTD